MLTVQPICSNYETDKKYKGLSDRGVLCVSHNNTVCEFGNSSDTFAKSSKSDSADIAAEGKLDKKKKERHFFKALASTLVTGGGQILDGRIGEGIKQNLVSAAISLGGYFGSVMLSAKGKLPLAMVVSTGATVAFVINKIHSILDAYRGGDKS